ncbi:MAG: class I SAM-dependent rRNA methyltransferase [Spirochaetes bacterium]|jgi:23S rRNA (cytosine1962-C5)-methyltransferase|nr:class I SAM-dependent rRNA methyltransferase [Spirochaetota bacterium]
MLQELRLKKNADRRIKLGHLWIYSNEIDTASTPLSRFSPGEQAVLKTHSGQALASVYVNPNTLICGRVISRNPELALTGGLLKERIAASLKLRERIFDRPFYRLVYGESDSLPGLVIDRFNDIFVVQISTAGMEQVKNDIINAVAGLFNPKGVFLKNNGKMRQVEGLGEYTETAYGEVPDEIPVIENDAYFSAPLKTGQKTGWYFDHRMNRLRLNSFVEGKSVLDMFSYTGAWGIQAAVSGAASVICADSSSAALDALAKNAELNNVKKNINTINGDAFQILKELSAAGEMFDIVILDPPAFITRKKDIKAGEEAYRRLNELAIRVMNDGGILASCSCSLHLDMGRLTELIHSAGHKSGRSVRIIGHGHQGPDHPVHPAIPETEYLKAVFAYLSF